MLALTVTLVAVVAVSALPVTSPVTSPVTPPVAVIAPVTVATPLILALPTTVKALYAEVVPKPTLSAVLIPV